MKNSFSLAAILLSAFVTTANAAPVLTNGGFEQNPPGGYGNHIYWDISPWVLGSGDSSNVVSVDGPGGQTWYDVGNNSGPGFDATGGAGHYLDITSGNNDFYQEFTPLCDGDVEFGAYFTTRDNRDGEATVTIKDASGSTDISAPAQVSLPGGTSGVDPWKPSSFTTTLVANTTYRFHVAMDNNMNIDNAFVNFGPSCDLHDDFNHDPSDDEIDDDSEDPEFTFETTKTCSPLKQDDQDENDAIKAECSITISYDTGTFAPIQISLDESIFMGSNLAGASITDITSADDWDCGTLPVTSNSGVPNCVWNVGSTPPPSGGANSTILNVTVEFPAESGQSWEDIKNCVSANIYIGGGTFLTSGDEPICAPLEFEKEDITIETKKSCEQPTISPDGIVTANCKIEVTYDSKGTVPRMVNLSEQMFVDSNPAQTTIISIDSDDAWECPALPLANDADPLNCAWPDTASVPPPVGIVTSVLDVVVQFSTDGVDDWQKVENCVNAHFDTQPDLTTDSGEMVCAEISKPKEEDASDEPQQCVPFETKVTCDTINGGYQITLSNTLTGSFDPSSIDVTSLTNGVTAASNPSNPLLLTLFGASPGQTVQMSLASTAYGKGSQPGLDLCCMGDVEITIPEDLVCEPPRETTLEINKSCEPFDGGEKLGNTICHIDIVYSGPAPTPDNPISITDASDSTTGITSFNGQDPTTADKDEWDCSSNLFPTTGPAVCEMHNEIDTTATDGYWDTYTSTLDLFLTTDDEFKNCATASIKQADGSVLESTNCYSKGDAALEITKTALFDVCHPGQICQFEYTVNNLGSGDYDGDITLQDTINPTGGRISNIAPALCSDASDIEGAGCTGNVSIPANGSVTFTVDYLAPPLGEIPVDQDFYLGDNCVTLADETLGEFDDPADIDGHKACTEFKIGAPVLEIEKIANGECTPDSECSFTINISTGDLPYDGQIALYENMGGVGGIITSISPLPSACSTSSPVQCILPVDLAADSTYSITVTSTFDSFDPDPSHNKNCVAAYMVDDTVDVGDWSDETLTQDNVLGVAGFDCAEFEQTDEPDDDTPSTVTAVKTCGPAMQQDIPVIQYIAECTITVTATGPLTQPYFVTDQLLGDNGQDSSHITSISHSDNWACNGAPYSSDDDVECTIQPNDFPSGLVSTIDYTVEFDEMSAEGQWRNCIAGEAGTQYSCVDIEFAPLVVGMAPPPKASSPILEPFKSQLSACKVNKAAQTYTCGFEIGVRNIGAGGYSGPMVLNDTFGSPSPREIGDVQGDGWDCLRTNGVGTSCLNGALSLAAGGSSSVQMSLTIPGLVNGGVFQNCVGIGVGNNEFQRALIAQTIMKRLGIDGGPVDGAPGRKTREGIKALQDRLGLEQTGEMDNALFTALGIPSADTGTQECIEVQLPPMPQLPISCKSGQRRNSKGQCYTPSSCQPRSTVKSGDGCACRYSGMRKTTRNSCVCKNTGLPPIKGVGCPTIKLNDRDPAGDSRACKLLVNGICLKR